MLENLQNHSIVKFDKYEMKIVFPYYLLLLGFSILFLNQKDEHNSLTIEISTTKYENGSILIALYNSEENYMKNSYRDADVKVKTGSTIVTFKNLKKDTYAFSLFHDLNENKKLDTNFFGAPKEPYQFSNGEKGRFGPPKFDKVKFNFNRDMVIKTSIE